MDTKVLGWFIISLGSMKVIVKTHAGIVHFNNSSKSLKIYFQTNFPNAL